MTALKLNSQKIGAIFMPPMLN